MKLCSEAVLAPLRPAANGGDASCSSIGGAVALGRPSPLTPFTGTAAAVGGATALPPSEAPAAAPRTDVGPPIDLRRLGATTIGNAWSSCSTC